MEHLVAKCSHKKHRDVVFFLGGVIDLTSSAFSAVLYIFCIGLLLFRSYNSVFKHSFELLKTCNWSLFNMVYWNERILLFHSGLSCSLQLWACISSWWAFCLNEMPTLAGSHLRGGGREELMLEFADNLWILCCLSSFS